MMIQFLKFSVLAMVCSTVAGSSTLERQAEIQAKIDTLLTQDFGICEGPSGKAETVWQMRNAAARDKAHREAARLTEEQEETERLDEEAQAEGFASNAEKEAADRLAARNKALSDRADAALKRQDDANHNVDHVDGQDCLPGSKSIDNEALKAWFDRRSSRRETDLHEAFPGLQKQIDERNQL